MENNFDQLAKELYPDVKNSGDIIEAHIMDLVHANRKAFIRGLKECMPLIEALKEIEEIVLKYHNENGNSPAANHCRNIAMEALAAFPTPDKPEDEPKEDAINSVDGTLWVMLHHVYTILSRHRDEYKIVGGVELLFLLDDMKEVLGIKETDKP